MFLCTNFWLDMLFTNLSSFNIMSSYVCMYNCNKFLVEFFIRIMRG